MQDFTVQLMLAELGEVKVNRAEALRYLGYTNKVSTDSVTENLIDGCEKELMGAVSGRCCYAYAPIDFPRENVVDIGFGDVVSKSLYTHLQGCNSVILFAATIGIGVDRLIAKYSRLSPAKSLVIDALASSAIEYWCDRAEQRITAREEKHCSRFSAGYGDFSLEHQRDFVQVLDVSRRLGVTLSDSLLMTPAKSVTAVIGLGAMSKTCEHKCAVCGNKQCIYRDIE